MATAVQAAVIGPAGENRVRMACVLHHYNVAGRTGMGAVMGAKNLKAVCVMGSAKLPLPMRHCLSKCAALAGKNQRKSLYEIFRPVRLCRAP